MVCVGVCVREVCVVVLEQILQLYPDERQSKKVTKVTFKTTTTHDIGAFKTTIAHSTQAFVSTDTSKAHGHHKRSKGEGARRFWATMPQTNYLHPTLTLAQI